MSTLLFSMPGQRVLSESLLARSGWTTGQMILRHFPDGETYIRVLDEVRGRDVAILCQLHQPDSRVLPLLLLADTRSGCAPCRSDCALSCLHATGQTL
jgi:ribose-phosphate pyrophosphokinase